MTDTHPECPFCQIAAGVEPARVVFASDDTVAFFPDNPATPGHTLVIPRQHIPDIYALDADTAHALIDTTTRVARAVEQVTKPDGLNLIQSNGEAATQSVYHLHIHVLPRWDDDHVELDWPEHPGIPADRLSEIRSALTDRLAT